MIEWRLCPRCGTKLERARGAHDEHVRPRCPACGFVAYDRPNVSAGVIVEEDGKILLAQRSHDPWKGAWNIPAGYVEGAEDPRLAAAREAEEETRIAVEVVDLVDVFHNTDDPRGAGVFVVYRARRIGGEPGATVEVSAVGWFARDEVPERLAGGGQDIAIRAWARSAVRSAR